MPSIQLPAGLDPDLAKEWFGDQFHALEPVVQLWLGLGRFPSMDWSDDFDTRFYVRFTDGTVIWRPNEFAPYRVLGINFSGGPFPEGMDVGLAKRLFGKAENDGRVFRFRQKDPVCRLWLGLRRYPRLVWTNDFDTRTYFRFSDGTVIWRRDDQSEYQVLAANPAGTPFPLGMDNDLAKLWFGESFEKTSPVGKLWLRVGRETKRFPTFLGSTGPFVRFSDGAVFRKEGNGKLAVFPPTSVPCGLSKAGGAWAALDVHNPEIGRAAVAIGVPPNLLKSLINRESSGNWERDGSRVADVGRKKPDGTVNHILPFVGIFETTAASWGYDFNEMIGNKYLQIEAMATIIKGLAEEHHGFENAATVYFGGPGALKKVFIDEFGMRSDIYAGKAIAGWTFLDSLAPCN